MSRRGLIIIILFCSALTAGCRLSYIGGVGYRQLSFFFVRRPVEEVLEHAGVSQTQKDKIHLILAAKTFGEQEMGLERSDNYSKYVHLDHNFPAYVLTAAHKDKLERKMWWFPIVGRFPYKGFFDFKELKKEQAVLEKENFDTFVQPMSAYSTLGWCLDPIFSTYLDMEDYDLADMIIHESVHLTIFVKGKMQWNEQIATFLGRMGAIAFLERYRGENSMEATAARDRWADDLLFSRWMKGLTAALEKLYDSDMTKKEKIKQRSDIFRLYQMEFQQLKDYLITDEYLWIQRVQLNNAVVLALLTYTDNMQQLYHAYRIIGYDLARMVDVLKTVSREKDPIEKLKHGIKGGNLYQLYQIDK